MAKESKYGIDKRLVFRETFNSFPDIAENGGVATSVTLSNSIGTFNGTTSKISYPQKTLGTVFTFLFRGTITNVAGIIAGLSGSSYLMYYESNVIYFNASASSNNWNWTYNGDKHTFVITRNGTSVTLYIDGVSLGTKTLSGANNISYLLSIGSGNTSFYKSMTADLVEIYNQALTATEVSELYKGTLYKEPNLSANTVLDINPNLGSFNDKYNHTVTNTAVSLVKSGNARVGSYTDTNNSVLSITNTSDLIFGNGATDTPFSIEAWLKITSAGKIQRIMLKSTTKEFQFLKNATNNLRLNCFTSVTIYIGRQGAFNDLAGWHHAVATYSGNKTSEGIKIYLDGIQIDTTNDQNGTYVAMSNSLEDLRIGNGELDGSIGRTRIFNKELSQSEITRLYNSQKHLYR